MSVCHCGCRRRPETVVAWLHAQHHKTFDELDAPRLSHLQRIPTPLDVARMQTAEWQVDEAPVELVSPPTAIRVVRMMAQEHAS